MATSYTAKDLQDKGVVPERPPERFRRLILDEIDALKREGHDETSALQTLLPNTVLDEDTLRVAGSALLSGANVLAIGPPGSGKTNLAKDLWSLYPKEAFAVADCPVQDDPASLVDPAFAKAVPACPVCKINHGGTQVDDLGDFDPAKVDPKSVPVKVVHLREGYGFARIQGSPEVFPDYLTGALNLRKLEEVGDPESPLVLEPGKLMQANRGVLLVDEIGKLPRGTQNVLLQALQESIVTPAKSRETFPASFVAITTSNLDDLDLIVEPLIGRLASVFVDFNRSHAKNRRIIDQALPPGVNGSGVLPGVLRDASVLLMQRWRTADHGGELGEVGSNRTMIDVLRRAESHAVLAGARHVGVDHFQRGALDAMQGRLRARGAEGFRQNREVVEAFVAKHAPAALAEAGRTTWCVFFKDVLKEDKGEAQRVASDARKAAREGIFGQKFEKFAAFVRERDGERVDDALAAHVFGLLDDAGVFRDAPAGECP